MKYNIYTIEFKDINGTSLRKEKIISSLEEEDIRELLNYDVQIVGCEEYKGKINL